MLLCCKTVREFDTCAAKESSEAVLKLNIRSVKSWLFCSWCSACGFNHNLLLINCEYTPSFYV